LTVILIPFSVFFGCCVAQFYFLRRVRQALAERHPDVWRDISIRAWSVDSFVYKFAWRRRDRRLDDPDLTAKTKQLLRLNYLAIGVWLACCGLLITGVGLGPL